MTSVLGDPALFQDEDLIRVTQGRDPVRDQNDRRVRGIFLQFPADPGICLSIHCRQGIVKDHDRGAADQHLCHCRPLLLPARERHAAFSHKCIIAVGETIHSFIQTGDIRRPPEFLQIVYSRLFRLFFRRVISIFIRIYPEGSFLFCDQDIVPQRA